MLKLYVLTFFLSFKPNLLCSSPKRNDNSKGMQLGVMDSPMFNNKENVSLSKFYSLYCICCDLLKHPLEGSVDMYTITLWLLICVDTV